MACRSPFLLAQGARISLWILCLSETIIRSILAFENPSCSPITVFLVSSGFRISVPLAHDSHTSYKTCKRDGVTGVVRCGSVFMVRWMHRHSTRASVSPSLVILCVCLQVGPFQKQCFLQRSLGSIEDDEARDEEYGPIG